MKNKLIAFALASAALTSAAMAQIDTADAGAVLTEATTKGTTVLGLAFPVIGVFIVAAIVIKGMKFAKK